MKKCRKSVCPLVMLCITCFFVFATTVFADTTTESNDKLEQKAKEILGTDNGEIDVTKVITEYEELSKQYTNDEIADMIEQNKEELSKNGISSDAISAGTQVLRTMEPEKVTKILKEDINIEEIKEKIDEGYTPTQIVEDVSSNLTTKEKISIGIKLLLANKIVKTTIIILAILVIYSIMLRWIIYKKAGKHGFAAIIPIYRDIVYFKICSISPWVVLLILIPIIGWLILFVLKIISRFELSYNFGKKTAFGFGLWLLPVIFESIIAFSKMKYEEMY